MSKRKPEEEKKKTQEKKSKKIEEEEEEEVDIDSEDKDYEDTGDFYPSKKSKKAGKNFFNF